MEYPNTFQNDKIHIGDLVGEITKETSEHITLLAGIVNEIVKHEEHKTRYGLRATSVIFEIPKGKGTWNIKENYGYPHSEEYKLLSKEFVKKIVDNVNGEDDEYYLNNYLEIFPQEVTLITAPGIGEVIIEK
jgi:hypothetical protein